MKRKARRNTLAAITAATLTLLPAGLASAADIPMFMKAPANDLAPGFSWTGAYIGLQAGYAWGYDHTNETFTATGGQTGFDWWYNMNNFVGGVYLGANQQYQNLVLGIEGDIEYAANKGGFYDPPGAGDTRIKWQGSVRGRLGYAWDRVLLYVSGGLSFADISHTYVQVITPIYETTAGMKYGWTAGLGIEYAMTSNVLARIEYRHTDYGAYSYNSITSFPGLTGRQTPRLDTLRVGLAYKF